MPRSIALTFALGALVAPSAHAQRHDVRAHISTGGLEFVSEQIPGYIPDHLTPPEVTKSVACVDATQRDTVIDLRVEDFALTAPYPGGLRLDFFISGWGTGEVFAEDLVFCLDDVTCQESFTLAGRLIVDVDVEVVDQRPRLTVRSAEARIDPDAFDLTFSGCGVSGLANWIVELAEGSIIDAIADAIEGVARDSLMPALTEILQDFAYAGMVGSTSFDGRLEAVEVALSGVKLRGSLDLGSSYPPDQCIKAHDRGEPEDVVGKVPDLTSGTPSHVGLAINFGAINDAMYQAWKEGLLCLTEQHLAALGVELPLQPAANLLPGFPPGSRLGARIVLRQPVTFDGVVDDQAAIGVHVRDLEVSLTGRAPDGSERHLTALVSADATAAIGIDPTSNALVGELTSARLVKLELDQVGASKNGFDVDRLRHVVETTLIPKIMTDFGQMPIAGPVFSGEDYAVIVRGLDTTDAYLAVKADLFRVPWDDVWPPDTTIVKAPTAAVSPKDARLHVEGVDSSVPGDLIRYVTTVDGVARPPSYVREIAIGEPGVTATYQVSVAAMDLGGLLDRTPATVEVLVDGTPPELLLLGDRVRDEAGAFDLVWTASDDRTDGAALSGELVIYAVTDAHDLLAVEEIERRPLVVGQTRATIDDLPSDQLYRIELSVKDEVGNVSRASVLVDLRSGGCSAAGGAGGVASGALLLLGLAHLRRRERR